MSYANCLAGGVVLGALLMHMIPEMGHVHLPGGHHDCGHGHSHISLLSASAFVKGHGSHHHSYEHGHSDKKCCGDHADHDHKSHDDGHGHGKALKNKTSDDKGDEHKDHGHGGFAVGSFWAGVSFLILLAVDRLFMHSHARDHDHGHSHGTGGMKEAAELPPKECRDVECGGIIHSADPEEDDCASCHSEDLMGGCHMDGLDERSSKTQALVFVLALSLHSFLEGLGVATKSSKEQLLLYLVSLFAHKWLEAFALGVNVMNANFTASIATMLVIFYAILTPAGIFLGMGFAKLTVDGPYALYTMQCLNGLAVGSFLFVSCIEMIPPEFHKKTRHTPWKFLLLCAGFGMMAIVSTLHFH
jgi:zinc transporter ZupT